MTIGAFQVHYNFVEVLSLLLSLVHCVCSVCVCMRMCVYVHVCACMCSAMQFDHVFRFIYPLPQSCNVFLKYKVILFL